MGAGCIVHCNKVSKPVKGTCLLLCINSILYFLLTSYTLMILIMFLKVLSHFIMKNKFHGICRRRGLEIDRVPRVSIVRYSWWSYEVMKFVDLFFMGHPAELWDCEDYVQMMFAPMTTVAAVLRPPALLQNSVANAPVMKVTPGMDSPAQVRINYYITIGTDIILCCLFITIL